MNLLPNPTQPERDLQAVDESIRRTAEALNHTAAVMAEEHAKFWAKPSERLLAVLNADVPRTLAIFAANTATGKAINAQLDQLGLHDYPKRVPTQIGRAGVEFDQEAVRFTYTEPSMPLI